MKSRESVYSTTILKPLFNFVSRIQKKCCLQSVETDEPDKREKVKHKKTHSKLYYCYFLLVKKPYKIGIRILWKKGEERKFIAAMNNM